MFTLLRTPPRTPEEKKARMRLMLIVGGALLGVLLLFIGSRGMKTNTQEETTAPPIYDPEKDEILLYREQLEEEIRTLCASVRGVDNVTVVAFLSGSFSSVYATEWKDGNEEYVIIGSGSGASALYLSRATPELVGIGVVCRGGGSDVIREELTALLGATYHLSSNRIYVTEAK